MTNNPLPAALASIKRYAIPEFGNALYEDKDGFLFYVDDVAATFATLPPPADEPFAWYIDGESEDGTFKIRSYTHDKASVTKAHKPLFSAPPADSAMAEALRRIDALAKDGDMDGIRDVVDELLVGKQK